MIAIIDYDTGNLRSVANALHNLGADFEVTCHHQRIRSATHVLLPGVGEASSAMEKMRAYGLDTLVPELTQPVLGICIGQQLMCRSSEEGDARCMGIFPTEVVKMPVLPGYKIPHMGWDTVGGLSTPLFCGIAEDEYFYYVHSFAARLCTDTIAVTEYSMPFSAALARDNFFGVQFHPEKSGEAGLKLLDNFLKL